MKYLITILIILLAQTAEARADIAVDQMTLDVSPPSKLFAGAVGKVGTAGREIEAAQTLTMGRSGYLSQIDVWVGRQEETTGDLVLSILWADTWPGEPIASFLIPSETIDSESLFTMVLVSVDVSTANIRFDAADTFAVALSAPDAPVVGTAWPPFSWAGLTNSDYDGGMRYICEVRDGPEWKDCTKDDQAVRTWVNTTPEPATVALLLLGTVFITKKGKK